MGIFQGQTDVVHVHLSLLDTSHMHPRGNCGGLLSSNIYYAWEAPRYITSLTVDITMAAILVTASSAYTLWMRWENRRRDKRNGPGRFSTEGITGSRDPRFRFET
ncbi:hypothetical protein N7474_009170 [Penicillium riverlandense]|uniref:uncharacterized protein n=1 Tax=Penicillium riverlandense TaxID=1903569 RepID=UPI0025474E90|nr:uncharacterized protein N7474_009170 [Penicillium riverlandense]KAJ5807901.1 hypothetical protein N7474_009170 [Penicillium riverlandense]